MNYFQKLRLLLNKQNQRHLILLVVFSILISIIETVGISAIMPFIDIATNFDQIQSNNYYRYFFELLSFEKEIDFVIFLGVILIGFYFFRGGLNLVFTYSMARFSQGLYAQTTKKLFRTYLQMPYSDYSRKNSSYLTKTIVTEASLVSSTISAVLLMISEFFVVIFLYLLMWFASWQVTIVFTVIMFLKLMFLTRKISIKIKTVGSLRASSQLAFYEIVNRVFGNFKYIKLQDKARSIDINNQFSQQIDTYARSNVLHAFFGSFPRLFLETSGFGLIILSLVLMLYLTQSQISHILPVLSFFVLSLYRLLPSVNRIVTSYNTLMYHHKSVDIVTEELETNTEELAYKKIAFDRKITLQGVGFAYQDKQIFKEVNLTIYKGEKVAFIGESGAGKSTLVDLIAGLNQPNIGIMSIDGVTVDNRNLQYWRSQIGYIPQQVYLFDGTISENVCFGRKFNRELLETVLKQANILDFLNSKQGINTLVGEGGIQLSGGQKQRIAIARALYGKPEILILDEATSSLDDKTELNIMREIYRVSHDKTLIVIAHRLSTIKDCNRIFKMSHGQLVEQ